MYNVWVDVLTQDAMLFHSAFVHVHILSSCVSNTVVLYTDGAKDVSVLWDLAAVFSLSGK